MVQDQQEICDERLGWTGDLEVFAPTASFLYDVSGLLQSWLRDLAVEQRKAGESVPHVVPNVLGTNSGAAAAWADAATVVPWVRYQRFGDMGILADEFESMRAWVDYVTELAGESRLWDKGFQFGDWLDPTAPADKPAQARTDKAIVASAYFFHSAELVARAAELLGHTDEQKKYQALASEARAAFAREYITPSGRLMCDAETAYALAIAYDLFSTSEQRQRAGKRLNELVRESGYRIRTGFVGTPLIGRFIAKHRGNTRSFLHESLVRLGSSKNGTSWKYDRHWTHYHKPTSALASKTGGKDFRFNLHIKLF